MFSPAQASVSLGPLLPVAPMDAMFNLLFRFLARNSVGTPNASAPAASEVVLTKSRRFHWRDFFCWLMRKELTALAQIRKKKIKFFENHSPGFCFDFLN